jgi:transcriptional regulator with XRE-family HTH domain
MAKSGPHKNTGKIPILKGNHFIKEWRIYREMTVAQLAETAEMSTGNVSALENRRQGYSPEGLEKLAKALRTTPTALLEVNPLKDDIGSFWPLWQRASKDDREMLKSMAERLVQTSAGKK